jgi:peptide/nickel transport system permease protein
VSVAVQEHVQAVPHERSAWADAADATFRYLRRNPSLLVGLLLLLILFLFVVIGDMIVDTARARPLSARALQPPSWVLPFGSDKQGRDLFAVLVAGTPLTVVRIGLVAGFMGVAVGSALAFIAAYYGGLADAVIRTIVDVGLTVPPLMVLIIIAMAVKSQLGVDQMALIIASLAWLYPARIVRSQVLTLRERGYVQLGRLSGMNGPMIIVLEMLPNLLPYLVAALVGATSAAILASIGLEVLGLGSPEAPTLGMTLYWVNYNAAIINGWWWWWVSPIVIIAILFIGLLLITVGLDEFANPRLRRAV